VALTKTFRVADARDIDNDEELWDAREITPEPCLHLAPDDN
jgi:hypothetical protein